MFGRKSGDDYEEYNQRQNAKYDDDYIRDTEEYREECTHSHEQSYSNFDMRETHREYREECRHDHEQTYEDFNSELRPYDEFNETEKLFVPKLADGEYILWCGKTEKTANSREKGTGCSTGCLPLGIVAALILFPLFGMVSIGVIVMCIIMMKSNGTKDRSYAITNYRYLSVKNGNYKSVPLNFISNVTSYSSPRNIGYVMFRVNQQSPQKPKNGNGTDGIFGVKEPDRVKQILKDAIDNIRRLNRKCE
jgi:hypothetical protein